jgi:hypothetical protein
MSFEDRHRNPNCPTLILFVGHTSEFSQNQDFAQQKISAWANAIPLNSIAFGTHKLRGTLSRKSERNQQSPTCHTFRKLIENSLMEPTAPRHHDFNDAGICGITEPLFDVASAAP